jgi:glycine betaine/choline ABC-type transport system substrate-binding protein
MTGDAGMGFLFFMPGKRVHSGKFALLLLVFASVIAAGCGARREETIVVGSKNFTEQIVLAELFAQQIEAHSSLHVERRVNLGGTLLCHQALVSGKIDLYPEYTGTALNAVLNDPPKTAHLTRRNGALDSAMSSWSARTDIVVGRPHTACIFQANRESSILACSIARLQTIKWTSWQEIRPMA